MKIYKRLAALALIAGLAVGAVGCTKEVKTITLDKTELEVVHGESFTITATVLPNDAEDKSVSWSIKSYDGAVLLASDSKTAKKEFVASELGEATIIATSSNGRKSRCLVTVTENEEDIEERKKAEEEAKIAAEKKAEEDRITEEKNEMFSKISELLDRKLAFDAGDYVVGDIPKGEYAYIGIDSSKYYSEEDSAGNIIDNEIFDSFGYVYVHGVGNIDTSGILVNVNAFGELGVTGAKQLYEYINMQSNYTQSGMYKIGSDIPAGLYTIESMGSGYFALLTGPVGNNEIIENDNFNGKKQVSVSNGQYLELSKVMISE